MMEIYTDRLMTGGIGCGRIRRNHEERRALHDEACILQICPNNRDRQ